MKRIFTIILFTFSITAVACPERHEASQTENKSAKSKKEMLVASRSANQCLNDNECGAFETCVSNTCVAGKSCHVDSECGAGGNCVDGTCF